MDKEKIKLACLKVVQKKLDDIQAAIDGYKVDLLSESKSSAGDKHETGRAILQLEMEKLGQQYQTVLAKKTTLSKIEFSNSEIARIGSLVVANGNYYFLATSIGQVVYNNKTVMVISVNSPIGKLLLGKKEDDSFLFNAKQLSITKVL